MRLPATVEQRTRAITDTDFVLRAAAADAAPGFVGHAAVFDSRTAIGNPLTWGFYEEVAAGAFTKTLREGDARFLIDHDSSLIVARVSAGDLRLAEDRDGLAVDADLDLEVSYVRDLARNVEKRRVTGMSFGFQVIKDDWTTETVETNDGQSAEVEVRTIREVKLFEVSAVTFPAYDETDAALRSATIAKVRRSLKGWTPDFVRAMVRATDDTDDDPMALTAAVDAAIDEAINLHAAGEDEQAWALITAADTTVDALMALMGIPDPDDTGDRSTREPARSTRGTEPANATREHMDRTLAALAARYRIPA